MEQFYFISAEKRSIEDKHYYCIYILDFINKQVFSFYHIADNKAKNFVEMHKQFDNISSALTFVVKRNNKISFDIK